MAGAPLAELGMAMGLDDRLTSMVEGLEDKGFKQLAEKPIAHQIERMQDNAMKVAEQYWAEVAPDQPLLEI